MTGDYTQTTRCNSHDHRAYNNACLHEIIHEKEPIFEIEYALDVCPQDIRNVAGTEIQCKLGEKS